MYCPPFMKVSITQGALLHFYTQLYAKRYKKRILNAPFLHVPRRPLHLETGHISRDQSGIEGCARMDRETKRFSSDGKSYR